MKQKAQDAPLRMLRDLLDIASLEDFVHGLARSARLRVCVFDEAGELICASAAVSDFARLTGRVLGGVPRDANWVPVPAHDPPARVAFVASAGVWYVVAPVPLDDRVAGYVGVGEYRDGAPPAELIAQPLPGPAAGEEVRAAWERLAPLDRSGQAHAVVTARWGARQLATWCRRETRLHTATAEVALLGDIAHLLTGEEGLQAVLDRIVAETARVMQCPFASLRLYDEKTQQLAIKAVYNLPADYLGKGAVVRTAGKVTDEALRGHVVYVEDVATDPRVQYPEEARRQGIVSMLTAGVIYRGRPLGVIRVYTRTRRRFRKAQRDLLRAVAYQAAIAIVHARLAEERLRSAETQRQLELAGDLQARMLRIPPPVHPRVQTALVFHPTYQVAGDFGEFLTLRDGRLAAVIGDVVGKGIPASLLMSTVRGALRAAARWCDGPAEVLTALNQQVCRETLPREFVTLLLLAIDDDARRLTYANAGHEPLLLLRGGEVRPAAEGDLVAGVDPGTVYREHVLPLEVADLLLLHTDGVVEARNFADEQFGRVRLSQSLQAYGDLAPEQVLRNIVWDVRRFVGLAEQADDMTLLALRVTG